MYAIVVYDTATERNRHILKILRRTLHHVQNSVFEGHLSKAQSITLKSNLTDVIDPTHDRVRIYLLPTDAHLQYVHLGVDPDHEPDIL